VTSIWKTVIVTIEKVTNFDHLYLPGKLETKQLEKGVALKRIRKKKQKQPPLRMI
jgi:hypothetical protein